MKIVLCIDPNKNIRTYDEVRNEIEENCKSDLVGDFFGNIPNDELYDLIMTGTEDDLKKYRYLLEEFIEEKIEEIIYEDYYCQEVEV